MSSSRQQRDTLVQRAAGGDRSALDALFKLHLPGLRAFLQKQMSGPVRAKESASDVAQSICRELIGQLADFRAYGGGEDAFRGWLYARALRKLIDRHRFYKRRRRDPAREHAPSPEGSSAGGREQLLDLLPGPGGTPSRMAMAGEDLARVKQAMRSLPPHYQEILTLAHFTGQTHAEIAERLQKTEGAVRLVHFRALARLKETLATGDPQD